ncbi:MAG: hypothetical protein R3E48_02515 [Burkholderiaceae bacterium]
MKIRRVYRACALPGTIGRRAAIASSLAALSLAAQAAPPAGSAYFTDVQQSHVEDQTGQAIGTVNMIMCFMRSMRPDLLVNQGPYAAMFDANRCEKNQGSASSAPKLLRAVVDSSRGSNTEPMQAKVWLEEQQDGGSFDIYVRTRVEAAPSASERYGRFRLDYGAPNPQGGAPVFQGFLLSDADGVSFVERERKGATPRMTQLKLTPLGTEQGEGALRYNDWDTGNPVSYTFGFNATHFRRSGATSDLCFSRRLADAKTSVWRYGLYDETTGERIERNSGFPFSAETAGGRLHGYIGYHGLSVPPEALDALPNGATIERESHDGGQAAQRYTLVRTGGKLMRHVRQQRTLAAADGIDLHTFTQSNWPGLPAGLVDEQVAMSWDEANSRFVIRAKMQCGQSGCQFNDLPAPVAISGADLAGAMDKGLFAHADQLGGQVFVPAAAMTDSQVLISFRSSQVVAPGTLAAGTSLYCIENCPTAAGLAGLATGANGDPFGASAMRFGPVAPGDAVTYQVGADGTLMQGGQPVVFAGNASALDGTRFQGGIQSGRLVTALSPLMCDQNGNVCAHMADGFTEFYTWETGPNPWNEYAGARDGQGNLVAFEPPLTVSWQVPADAAYDRFAGRSLLLQYAGFGDLHGLPSFCVDPSTNAKVACGSPGSRWVPMLSIPYDATHGVVSVQGSGTRYLVKWLGREVRFAQVPNAECAALNLGSITSLPGDASMVDPSDPADAAYIGARPEVTAAPRVINGAQQY